MKNVYLAPCDSPNFDNTVQEVVNLNAVSDVPEPLDGEDEVRFWGARTGSRNEANFEKMESGDLVLFYQNGAYIGTAWVNSKFRDGNCWASTTYWRGGESNLIYTLTDFEEISVSRQKVNTIFGYTKDYYPQGLMRVNPNNVTKRPAAIKLALYRTS
ncbi:hypothetical protein [Halovivax gelatinilyticus]|uniref:hypothetical protein n=1 Tax=Halovivax gelatinilyticus TaxID=2961597 RepID=UPI0020CA867C|nr:hypothetical protein [Halovivax gelatinilyticus]